MSQPPLGGSSDPVDGFKRLTLRKLAGLRCRVHGKSPIVEFHGLVLRDIRISIRCCCQELSAHANRAIAQSPAID